jgi:hypothetical protein
VSKLCSRFLYRVSVPAPSNPLESGVVNVLKLASAETDVILEVSVLVGDANTITGARTFSSSSFDPPPLLSKEWTKCSCYLHAGTSQIVPSAAADVVDCSTGLLTVPLCSSLLCSSRQA